jgi:hypothetical protein
MTTKWLFLAKAKSYPLQKTIFITRFGAENNIFSKLCCQMLTLLSNIDINYEVNPSKKLASSNEVATGY